MALAKKKEKKKRERDVQHNDKPKVRAQQMSASQPKTLIA